MAVAQYEADGGEAARQLSDAHRQLLGDNSIQFELPTANSYDRAQQPPLSQQPPPYGPSDPSAVPPQAATPSPSTLRLRRRRRRPFPISRRRPGEVAVTA
jgi:hypothetical protein